MKRLFLPIGLVGLIALTATTSASAKGSKKPTVAECTAQYDAGAAQFKAQELDEAWATFKKGYATCGPGYGFIGAQGFIRATQGKLDEAAELYIQEVSQPNPQALVFGNLERIRDQLPEPLRRRIAALGATVKTPVHVRGAPGEYSWARAFTCLGNKKLNGEQQSVATGGATSHMHLLEFNCNDGMRHKVYFDYGEEQGADGPKR